jgi:hypothetical protein
MTGARKLLTSQPWEMQLKVDSNQSKADPSCIGVGENIDPSQLLDLAIDQEYHHICQKNGHAFESELLSARCMIESAESYRQFPISTVLNPNNRNNNGERSSIMLDTQFDCSSQKLNVLAEITKIIESKAIPQTVIDDVVAASDELFTNAIFNAPFVDLSSHTNPGISRQELEVKLADGKFARIFVALSEDRLLIGCEDPYGSLHIPLYMKKIRATYLRGPAATMNFGPGGAGIGSYIIFNAGASLYFGVWPGQMTLLCCVVPLGRSNRDRLRLGKHLHWIQT